MSCQAQPSDHTQDVNMLEKEIERKGFNAAPFSDTVTFVFKQKPNRRLKPEEIRTDWGKVKALFKGTDYTINPFKGIVPKEIAREKHVRYLELASHKYRYIIGIKGQRISSVSEVKINVPTDAPPH
jgi:hypothetical protein